MIIVAIIGAATLVTIIVIPRRLTGIGVVYAGGVIAMTVIVVFCMAVIIAIAVVLLAGVAILTAIVVLTGRLAGVRVICASVVVALAALIIIVMSVVAPWAASTLIVAADARVRLIDMIQIVAMTIVLIDRRRLIRRRIH